MKPENKKLIMALSGLFDMFLGAYLFLAGIGWLPFPFGELSILKWVGLLIFLTGAGVFTFFITHQTDD